MGLPLILSSPHPRSIDMIFTDAAKAELYANYRVTEAEPDTLSALPDTVLTDVRYILGQPPVSAALLARMPGLRAVLNVESNLLPNMPCRQRCFPARTAGGRFGLWFPISA